MTETNSSSVELLRELPTFSGLSEDRLERVSAIGRLEEIPDGTELMRQGGPASDLRIVVTGKFSLCIDLGGGRESCVMTMTRGEVVGWSAMLDQATWLASVTAVKPSSVLVVDGNALRALCESDHELGYFVMRNLFEAVVTRLHDTRMQLIDIYSNG